MADAPPLRDRMVIATKGGIVPGVPYDSSAAHLLAACDASLARLRIERIDLYQIHRHDWLAHPEETAGALVLLRDAGKIREVGVSNFTPAQADALQRYLPFRLATHQPEFSCWNLAPLCDGVLDQCLRERMTPLAWSPLAGGKLGLRHAGRAARAGRGAPHRAARCPRRDRVARRGAARGGRDRVAARRIRRASCRSSVPSDPSDSPRACAPSTSRSRAPTGTRSSLRRAASRCRDARRRSKSRGSARSATTTTSTSAFPIRSCAASFEHCRDVLLRRRAQRLRQHPVSIRLCARHRSDRVRGGRRAVDVAHPPAGRRALRRDVAAAARAPARDARSHARRPPHRQHHLERSPGRAARIRAALPAHARVHADPARDPRRQGRLAARRVLRARTRAARGAHGFGTCAALLLRRALGARAARRCRGGRRLPDVARAAAGGARTARGHACARDAARVARCASAIAST